MTTTYVRLKNRRGNRENLPQPLAEGEIGLATDTRELFIGAGSQDSKNRMVQVDSFLNAEVQTQSLIDTRLVMFTIDGTQSFLGDGISASSTELNSNVALTLPTGKSTPVDPDDITVTKFDLNNSPTAIPSSDYRVSTAPGTLLVEFVSTAIPEANSKIVVTPWTVNEIVSSVSSSGLGVETNQDLSNNALYIDLTTGTGFVDIGSGTQSQSNSAISLSGLTEIASANDNANLNIRGTISDLGYASSKLTVPGTLLVETDSPTQAILLSKFLNKALGTSQTSVASNIKIFTQDSKPVLETDQYIGQNGLIKSTLSANTSSTVFTYDVTSENTIIVDYSLKINNAYAVGTIKIISDGANVEYMDDRIETNDTSAVAFSTPSISGTDIKLSYTNADTTYDASMSYVLKRWLTS